MDHGRDDPGSQEYLWGDEDRRRGSLQVVLQESQAAGGHSEDLPFFPEEDDNKKIRQNYADTNIKATSSLSPCRHRRHRERHLLAIEKAPAIGATGSSSAPPPHSAARTCGSQHDAPPWSEALPGSRSRICAERLEDVPRLDRVYVNDHARATLGWTPRYDFRFILDRLKRTSTRHDLSLAVARKDITRPNSRKALSGEGLGSKAIDLPP